MYENSQLINNQIVKQRRLDVWHTTKHCRTHDSVHVVAQNVGACRAFIRRGRISRAIATPTSACVLKVAPAPKSNTTSQAVSAEAMPQPRMSPDSATRAVYANLFGCPAQFASVADVLPDSQGPAGDGNMTPLTDGFHCGTPTTMFAASVYTEQPKPGQWAVESENNDMRQVCSCSGLVINCGCGLWNRSRCLTPSVMRHR